MHLPPPATEALGKETKWLFCLLKGRKKEDSDRFSLRKRQKFSMFFFFLWEWSVYMYYVCVWYMCMCVCISEVGIIDLIVLHYVFWDKVSYGSQRSPVWPDWLSNGLWEVSCLHRFLPDPGLRLQMCAACWAFMRYWGSELMFSLLHRRIFKNGTTSRPQTIILKFNMQRHFPATVIWLLN